MRPLDRFLQMKRIQQISRHIRPGARVLDIGCADGVLYRTVPGIAEYVGVDPDAPEASGSAHIRFVRSTFPSTELMCNGQFDAIVALAVLEHIPLVHQPSFARACAECLRPGGIVAITVPSPAVDVILAGLKALRLVHGMREDQHFGFKPLSTVDLFQGQGLQLKTHSTFEMRLNHVFIFQKAIEGSLATAAPAAVTRAISSN